MAMRGSYTIKPTLTDNCGVAFLLLTDEDRGAGDIGVAGPELIAWETGLPPSAPRVW
jgi:hypothetical protein